MAENAVAAATAAGGGGGQAMAGTAFMSAAAGRVADAQRSIGEEAVSDIPRARVGQTAAEEIAASDRIARATRDQPSESGATTSATPAGRASEDQSIFQSDVPSHASRASEASTMPPPPGSRASESRADRSPAEQAAGPKAAPPTGSSGTLITGNVAQEVQAMLNSSATNPEIQRAFDTMFESKRDGLRSQIREEAADVSGKAIGDTFRTFLKGA